MNNAAGYMGYQLKELMRDDVIGSIFTDPNNPDDFIAGFVEQVGARSALVASVTPYGKMDGYFGVRLAAVLEVQYDSVYAERLDLLMKMDGQKRARMEIGEDEDALVFLLTYSAREGRAVTVWTATESYAGFTTKANDLFVEIEPVDFMGRRCPEMTFRLTDIEMASVGSEEELMYERLDDYHHEKRGEQ